MADVSAGSKEALVLILDIGLTMHNDSRQITSLLAKAKTFVGTILQKKIFLESKDEIALILVGSVETANSLAIPGTTEYSHIQVVQDLRPASWQLFRFVYDVEGTDVTGDFIDALVVAMDILHRALEEKSFTSSKVLYLSNFDTAFCFDQVDRVCRGMEMMNMALDIVGPYSLTDRNDCGEGFHCYEDRTREQRRAADIICDILENLDGESYSFEEALPALIYFQKEDIRPMPWNANLEIGTNLILPISAYIKVAESKAKPWKNAFAHKLNSKIERETTYHLNDEAQTEISKDNIIPAYKYGTTLVPFSEEDKINMEYQSGEKGMKVLGFTKKQHVKTYYFMGDKTMYIFGQKKKGSDGLASFIQAMYETETVAIVRYLYSSRSHPKMGFLAPRVKENYECLVFVSLPFMEDLRHFLFAPLDNDPKNLPSDEQLSAIDELITSMDLSFAASDNEGNRGEGLKPKYTVNPFLQYLYQCLQEKVLFGPDSPLPEISESILDVIEPSPELLVASEPVIEKMKKIFPLNVSESRKKRRYEVGEEIFRNRKSDDGGFHNKKMRMDESNIVDASSDASSDNIMDVGTINPVQDFQYLMNQSKTVEWFKKICKQLEDAILRLLSDEKMRLYHGKIVSCLREYRASSIKKKDPSSFNYFMKSLKGTCISKNPALWAKIISENLGLITIAECRSSTISIRKATKFGHSYPGESSTMS